jgi:hypothetical protein
MKTKQMTIIQILAVCALLTGSLFVVAAQTKSGPQKKKQPPKVERIKACCFQTPSGGLNDCNKPMPNGQCPAVMVAADCTNDNYNDCKKR